jgi:hypothetical protein
MNLAQLHAARRASSGMGSIEGWFFEQGLLPPNSGGGGNWYQDWGQGLIGQGLTALTNIFGRQPNHNPNPAPVYIDPNARAVNPDGSVPDDSKIGFEFDENGLRLGKTTITYATMLGIGGIFLLIQMRPFSRR